MLRCLFSKKNFWKRPVEWKCEIVKRSHGPDGCDHQAQLCMGEGEFWARTSKPHVASVSLSHALRRDCDRGLLGARAAAGRQRRPPGHCPVTDQDATQVRSCCGANCKHVMRRSLPRCLEHAGDVQATDRVHQAIDQIDCSRREPSVTLVRGPVPIAVMACCISDSGL